MSSADSSRCLWLGLGLTYAALFFYAWTGHNLARLPEDLRAASEVLTGLRAVLRV